MLWKAAVLAAALHAATASAALAHDPGLSSLDVHVTTDRIVVTVALAPPDARAAAATGEGDAGRFALNAIELRAGGLALRGALRESGKAAADGVAIEFERPPGSTLTVRSLVPARLARGHRQLLTVRGPDGRLLMERMLDARSDIVEVDLGSQDTGHSAAGFAALGIAHILGGYDHLLFLAALLLGVSGLGQVVKTVTAFTVAHSITLALAGLGLAQAPAGLVEPLIAASIVFVGVENLVRDTPGSRWKLTFAFGLVHGFGFAAALRELGLGGDGLAIVTALGSFNAGVEVGQVAVAIALWPLVRFFRTAQGQQLRLVPACSAAIALAGVYWFVERTMF